MDYRTEIYDTVIDGVVIAFYVKWMGGDWEENRRGHWTAYGDYKYAIGNSAESAALNLVKLLEK